MSTPFIGEIQIYAFDFAPRTWATCNGQLLPINQNQALFSLLGTTYGGNGQTTFALPDLRGRVAIHMGQGPGLSSYVQGQTGGEERHTLSSSEIPQHTHSLGVVDAAGDAANPVGNRFGVAPSGVGNAYGGSGGSGGSSVAVPSQGGNQPHNNLQPYLALNFCIALEGIFPSRN